MEKKKENKKRKILIVIIIFIGIIFFLGVKNVIWWEENIVKESDEMIEDDNEEKATIKELKLRDEDGKKTNYCFKYNNNIVKAKYTKDNWKIIDSYKITNEKDMAIICEALIKIHPIHGKDGKSCRTVDDLVDEWVIHNKAYEILPETSKWKTNAKDVDLNPADQGKTLEEFIKDRIWR